MMTEISQPSSGQLGRLTGATQTDNYYELHFLNGEAARFYILADGIFRFYLDPTGTFEESNVVVPDLSKFNNELFKQSTAQATDGAFIIRSKNIRFVFQKNPALISIFDEKIHRYRMMQESPLKFSMGQSIETLKQNENEFYYGGGLQGGQFSHKNKKILIKNTNIVGAGGVINPMPFFWSNAGFGELRNTYNAGVYDFKANNQHAAILSHDGISFDTFYLIGDSPAEILQKFYALTGKPVMLPKYSLGLGYISNFLDTYWQKSQPKNRSALRFEDNEYYEKATEGIPSSLLGENDYQFSAKAMVDRFQKLHFPLSWFIPNYGTDSENEDWDDFNDYIISRGVVPGMYKTDEHALPTNTGLLITKDKDVNTEHKLLQNSLANRRSLVLSNNGHAGSQTKSVLTYGATGGEWSGIADQIASLLGISLSGQPNVGAAIDGIQGGGNAQVSVRDLEWKVFTPLLFINDCYKTYSKTPFAFNSKISRINRAYLKLREQIKPYLYDLIYQAQFGNPIMRALFVEFPQEKVNYTEQVKDEFMLGSNFLVAPITNGRENQSGESLKDRLYLPDHNTFWIDLFTGQKFNGGRSYNNLTYPLWHLPVFVRSGAIINGGHRIYTIYPQGKTQTTCYDDASQIDFGKQHLETNISSELSNGNLHITINKTQGEVPGAQANQGVWLNLMCDQYPGKLQVKINDEPIKFDEKGSPETFTQAKEGYYFNPEFNPIPGFGLYDVTPQHALQIKLAPRDIFNTKIEITINNFVYANMAHNHAIIDSALKTPQQASIIKEKTTAHSLTVVWPEDFDRVQIEVNGIISDGISGNTFTFHELTPGTKYTMRLRYIRGNKVSEWSDYFGGITKPDQLDYAVSNIKMSTSLASKPSHPASYATDLLLASQWESEDKLTDENNVLTFEFPNVEHLSRMVYVPNSINESGRILKLQLSISTDGVNFEKFGETTEWTNDPKNKVIGLRDVVAKAIKLKILQTTDDYVSAKEFYFFRPRQ